MTTDRTVRLRPDQLEHKHSARQLIRAVGGVDEASKYCRAGKSQLSDYCNPNVPSFMPSDVIADLEAHTIGQPDHPVMTRMLARLAGDLLVKPPEALGGPWGKSLKELSKDFGEVVGTITDCLGDDVSPGEVTAAEIRKSHLRKKLAALAEIVAEMNAQAERVLEEGK